MLELSGFRSTSQDLVQPLPTYLPHYVTSLLQFGALLQPSRYVCCFGIRSSSSFGEAYRSSDFACTSAARSWVSLPRFHFFPTSFLLSTKASFLCPASRLSKLTLNTMNHGSESTGARFSRGASTMSSKPARLGSSYGPDNQRLSVISAGRDSSTLNCT